MLPCLWGLKGRYNETSVLTFCIARVASRHDFMPIFKPYE